MEREMGKNLNTQKLYVRCTINWYSERMLLKTDIKLYKGFLVHIAQYFDFQQFRTFYILG